MLRVFFFLAFSCPFLLAAQDSLMLSDTLLEVQVSAYAQARFAPGSPRLSLDTLKQKSSAGSTLAELLSQHTPAYIKQYGSGMLGSISLRGTASSHTGLLWNGLPLNSPTLGQSDLSLFPAFALSGLSLQLGGGSALYGSGALAGSLQLESQAPKLRGWHLTAQQAAGSFGQYFSGLGTSYGTDVWQASLKLYHQQSENNFPYRNPFSTEKKSHMENAAWQQQGFVQSLGMGLGKNIRLEQALWYQQAWRQIQPQLGNRQSREEQDDENLRLSLQLEQQTSWGGWSVLAGWLQDEMIYNRSLRYQNQQHILRLQSNYWLSSSLELEAGTLVQALQARSDAYADGRAEQMQTDAFSRLRWQSAGPWQLSLNVRQAFTDGTLAPLTPALEAAYQLPANWLLRAALSRNYRVPTLNDRFWIPGGRADLRPEHSWQAETGLDAKGNLSGINWESQLNVFALWVDDWIMWLPGSALDQAGELVSAWGPQNIRKVFSRGAEGTLQLSRGKKAHESRFNLQLSYTNSTSEQRLHTYDRTIGKQLAYVPRWKGQLSLGQNYGRWQAGLELPWSSRRYTTGEESPAFSLQPYALLHFRLAYQLPVKQHQLNLQLHLQNILNRAYMLYENRPMPGRSFQLSLHYQFNSPTS